MAGADGTAAILRVVGSALAARRVGFWRLEDGGAALHCDTQIDLAAGTAAGGVRLRRTEVRRLFAAIEGTTLLDVADAAADPRTAELARLCLRPVGSRGLLSVPVAGALPAAGATPPLGALWVEDAGTGAAEAAPFARTAAALLARGTLPVPSGAPGAPAQAPASAPVASGRARDQALLARLRERSADTRDATELFPRLGVLALVLTGDTAIAAARTADGGSLFLRIRAIVAAAAAADGVACVQTLGERVLFADGFAGDGEAATRRLADLALALQGRLSDVFTEAGVGLDFRMGLDQGPAVGGRLPRPGLDQTGWEVFGEAVRIPGALADTAPAGAIQISETAQAALAADFLLRARGRFFVGDGGEIGTWLVAGHA